MFVVAAKVGCGFAVVLTFVAAVQAQSLTDPFLMFAAAGLIPVIGIEIPADITLGIVAAALMAVTVLLCREHVIERKALLAVKVEYPRSRRDPDYGELVPVLGDMLAIGKTVRSLTHDASIELYFWLRSFGRPITAQTWAGAMLRPADDLQNLREALHGWSERARAYLIKLTMF